LPTWGAAPTPTTREEAEEASMTGKNQEEAPSSPKRRQKWRLDETHKLIEVRSVMATQLRKDGSKKKPTWKDVAVTLAGLGFNRSPEQCSSMWSSLVKKYEVHLDSVPWMIIVDDFDSLGKQRLKAMICEPQLIHQSFRRNLCMP
jgi:hypothetical protein